MGSLTDEPVFWVEQMVNAGPQTVGALVERSHIGHTYITNFRAACERAGIRIVDEQTIPQTAQDITAEVTKLYEAHPDAIVHCGFGFGMAMVNMVLESLDWDPPRYMSTALSTLDQRSSLAGHVGLDRRRPVRRNEPRRPTLLDEFDEAYGVAPSTASRS